MSKYKKILKPLMISAITLGTGYGGYQLYNSYRVKNIDNLQVLATNIPQLIQIQSKHFPATEQQKKQLTENRQQSFVKSDGNNQEQMQNQQQKLQKDGIKDSQKSSLDTAKTVHPQKIIQAVSQENPSPSQPKSQKHESPTSSKQAKPQQQQSLPINVDFSKISRLSQLAQFSPTIPKQQLKTILIVSGIGFTQQFEQKLLQTIRSIKKLPESQRIQIYRANTNNQEFRSQVLSKYGAKLKDETIFLIKNQLDNSFVNIDFDMYMQYPAIISTYLTKLNLYDMKRQKEYMKKLERMSPNESYLMFIYDDAQPEQKKSQRLLAAKYIQMELALHHLDHAIKVLPVEASLVKNNKIIPEQKARANSIHIVRKHNELTHASPNLHLNLNNEIMPYHLLSDIGFHNKRGEVAVQTYLNKIQTFNSLSITTPHLLSVTIDKNRISTENYRKLMRSFKQFKRNNKFPEVGIALKFSEIPYPGKEQRENHQFSIKMANVSELEYQSYVHEIQKVQDAEKLGITEENWLKHSYEFLYPNQEVSEQLISDFVEQVLESKVPEYYRSDKPSTIQNVHKIVASNFDKQVLQNSLDHFVFQYSEHCPSCKMISPLIGYMNQILQPIPLETRFDIHVMNSQKNRVKSQLYSPYTPNMNYYKNQWKHSGPVRINLETLSHGGLGGLYDFCAITKMLKTIDRQKFNQAIQGAKGWKKEEFLL